MVPVVCRGLWRLHGGELWLWASHVWQKAPHRLSYSRARGQSCASRVFPCHAMGEARIIYSSQCMKEALQEKTLVDYRTT